MFCIGATLSEENDIFWYHPTKSGFRDYILFGLMFAPIQEGQKIISLVIGPLLATFGWWKLN